MPTKVASTAVVVSALLAFGAIRLPLETHIERTLRAAGAHQGEVTLALRDELGQSGLLAVLGGFRSLVASVLTIEATTARDRNEWGEVENRYSLATRLQPNVVSYWRDGHYQMGYDAINYYGYHKDNADLPVETLRSLIIRYARRAIEFLDDGLAANPGDAQLAATYAIYVSNKDQRPFAYDPCLAAEKYSLAAAAPDAPSYYTRFAALQLADCPGQEKLAHERLAELFRIGGKNRKPTLLRKLHNLEIKLGIPASQRLVPEAPPLPEDPAPQEILK